MLNAAVFGFYGLMCQPDLNLPIMNLDMKLHTSRNSAFYNDMEPETVSNTKAYRWIANSFFGIGVSGCIVHLRGVLTERARLLFPLTPLVVVGPFVRYES